MRYAIIGAGPSGVVAAETLRARDAQAEIVIVGGEAEPAYSRMAIPYLLAGQIDETGTYLRHTPDHFDKLGIRMVQEQVSTVDTDARRLLLSNGSSLDFDRLLIASGSHPVKPPVAGLDQPAIHHCWTLADARHIVQYAAAGSRVVLMGAGFIGSIIMEALVRRKVRLTLVEKADRMVPRMMDQTAGNLIKQWCIGQGVDVRTSTQVDAIDTDPSGSARYLLRTTPSGEIPADLVVVATGVRPTIGFLQGSAIETRLGVLVDDHLQTSVEGIYAAGDVCEGFDWNTGARAIHAIQPVAAQTGRLAALNMSGCSTVYTGSLGMNVLDSIGLISTSFGQWQGIDGGDQAQLLDESGYRYIKLQFEEDRLIGAITLGTTEHVGVIRGLIQSRTQLGAWRQRLIRDPSRVMEAYLANTQ